MRPEKSRCSDSRAINSTSYLETCPNFFLLFVQLYLGVLTVLRKIVNSLKLTRSSMIMINLLNYNDNLQSGKYAEG